MNKEEARKIFEKTGKFEEISFEEWGNLNNMGELSYRCSDGSIYLKPKEQWPRVFERRSRKAEVSENGEIEIFNKFTNKDIYFNESLPILYEAVELSKKIRN